MRIKSALLVLAARLVTLYILISDPLGDLTQSGPRHHTHVICKQCAATEFYLHIMCKYRIKGSHIIKKESN